MNTTFKNADSEDKLSNELVHGDGGRGVRADGPQGGRPGGQMDGRQRQVLCQ